MSAVLSANDLQPVADLIERLQNVRTAMRDLNNAYETGADYCVQVVQKPHLSDVLVASTHQLSYAIVMEGLATMEGVLLSQLYAKGIEVESRPQGAHA